MNADDHQIALYVYGAIIGLIVIGVPCILMGLLLYHGLRQDLHDLKLLRRKKTPRGFDVVQDAPRRPDSPAAPPTDKPPDDSH